jgi:hypothetical protein
LRKTAFAIVVERAVKFAASRGRRLKVHFEQCGKREDRETIADQRQLKINGMPFSIETSEKYQPLNAETFRAILDSDPERHTKENPLCQIADLVLYPIAKAKYEPSYPPYVHLRNHAKLIDCVVAKEDVQSLGIKYSCFDGGTI